MPYLCVFQRAQSSWVDWSKSNANEALGAGHQREMNENFGIARNKRQQLNEELSLINRRRQHSNSRAESEFFVKFESGFCYFDFQAQKMTREDFLSVP